VKLKIKSKPEDFLVEEIACLPLVKSGEFGVYRLHKKGWNTVELLKRISRELHVPLSLFYYGGRKDRHALTSQFITVKSSVRLDFKDKDHALEFIGFMERPMGPDLIQANKFKVTVRNLKRSQVEHAIRTVEKVALSGFPNYFDDQRFGCFDPRTGFLAEKLLKKEFSGALKSYLVSVYSEEPVQDKERKNLIFKHWKDWNRCLGYARSRTEVETFRHLIKHPKGLILPLRKIPHEELISHISAYQSFVWNGVLAEIIQSLSGKNILRYPGCAGDYIFPVDSDSGEAKFPSDLSIPTIPVKISVLSEPVKSAYAKLFERQGIKTAMFNNLKVRQAYFKSFMRPAIVKPQYLSYYVRDDDLYFAKDMITVNFQLPRGSFATMLLKSVFAL
jgi:tRNA pseudouridine13 synthase